jgi:hypothetical protein
MEIKRDNFRFNRIINPSNVIEESTLFYMEQNDIDDDDIVCGEQIEDGDNIIVLQNITEPYQGERYCYLKTNTIIGGDGHTKLITINKIIVDKNLINPKTNETVKDDTLIYTVLSDYSLDCEYKN